MKKSSSGNGLSIAMILVGVLILAASGILVGMQVGNVTRQSAIEASLAEKKAYEEALAAAEHEEAMKAQAEAEKAAQEQAVTITPSPIPDDIVVTPEQLAAMSEAIKGAGTAATSMVFSYADAQKNAGISLNIGNTAADGTTPDAAVADPAAQTATVQTPAVPRTICIDPGHQAQEMTDEEPNGPGSSVMKQKVSSGTTGEWSGKEEYEVNLEVSLKLRDILVSRGYTVVMTRETHDVTLSNVERAQIATTANADIFVRIHCNSEDVSDVAGVLCYGPASDNPYLTPEIIDNSQRLCEVLRDNQCAVTGQKALNNLYQNDMTGINWATMPVSIVEMGFMSNETEDLFISSDEGESQIAEGLANGIDAYFAG
ncbi:MAG TPA: N-acetylmuramoyl-L-alanine amidase [Lachnospiraceae bacterium]|nr:N-acetylmuramoyl-L-alanine amidase [Lachnospiraceae bacterium]